MSLALDPLQNLDLVLCVTSAIRVPDIHDFDDQFLSVSLPGRLENRALEARADMLPTRIVDERACAELCGGNQSWLD